MIAYASRTGTRTTLELLRRHGWRLIVSATGEHRNEGLPYAIDNGAWTAHQKGLPWDQAAFERLVASHGSGADFIVLPDIVGGGLASLELSVSWIPSLAGIAPLYLAVQDGIDEHDVKSIAGDFDGIFVGGTTEWKLKTMDDWGRVAYDLRTRLHIARVNTRRRIKRCHEAGAHSFDGSSVALFSKTIFPLDDERRQPVFDYSWESE